MPSVPLAMRKAAVLQVFAGYRWKAAAATALRTARTLVLVIPVAASP